MCCLGLFRLGVAHADSVRLADHVRAQRDSQALASLTEIESMRKLSVPERYLKGRLLERGGNQCGAADAFDLSATRFPADVALDVRRRWARTTARCGRCNRAMEALEALAKGRGTEAARDRALLARCEYDRGNFTRAAQEYRELLRKRIPGFDKVDATVRLARSLKELGQAEQAVEALERATITLAADAKATRLGDALVELGGRWPNDQATRLRRADVYYRARRYADVVEELETGPLPSKATDKAQWLHLRGMALFRMRHYYDEAAKALSEAARVAGKRGIEDEFHAARALARAGRDREAIRAFRRLVQRYPNHSRAAEAEYLAGWLEIRLGLRRGEVALERMLRGRRRRFDKWRRQALWQLGFRAVERRQYARAKRFLSRYAKEKMSRMEQAQAAYWLGRTYQGLKKWGLAIKAYRQAMEIEPLHWYASLAAHRLQRAKRKPGDPFPDDQPRTKEAPPIEIKWPASVLFYSRLGLVADAVTALRRERAAVLKGVPASSHTRALAQAYTELGAHRDAYRLAARLQRGVLERPAGDHAWWWRAAYPTPWNDTVQRWTAKADIEQAYVYATMRQESAYNPAAVSRAGAIGLLQLMPKVSARLAKSIGVTVRRQQLFDPEWNIRLGVKEIEGLYEEYGGVMPLSIAAYNAGSRRVREWIKRSGRMDLDRFVERIPFDETRNYVRRVMSHYARYRYLIDPEGGWPFTLPRRIRPPG